MFMHTLHIKYYNTLLHTLNNKHHKDNNLTELSKNKTIKKESMNVEDVSQ